MAQGLEVDVASQGDTECAALEDLREVLELHFQPHRPTVAPRVKSVEFDALRARGVLRHPPPAAGQFV